MFTILGGEHNTMARSAMGVYILPAGVMPPLQLIRAEHL